MCTYTELLFVAHHQPPRARTREGRAPSDDANMHQIFCRSRMMRLIFNKQAIEKVGSHNLGCESTIPAVVRCNHN
jgi:hypothetical protein